VSRAGRTVLAALAVAGSAASIVLALGALHPLVSGYQDSPVWVYAGVGAFWLALAAALVAVALRLLHRR
jgi:Na+/melibiose symporter-like transporter